MSRVILDHNVPAPLRRYLTQHQVRTAAEQGWGEIVNGDLIAQSEANGYEVLVTCDQNLLYQQNLSRRVISMVILGSNIWPSVQRHIREIVEAVDRAHPK